MPAIRMLFSVLLVPVLAQASPPAATAEDTRRTALERLAGLQEARGQLVEAARTYQRLALQAASVEERAQWLSLAGEARLHSGDLETTSNTARWLRRVVESGDLPAPLFERYQLAVGRLLAGGKSEAYQHYMRLARRWRGARPQLAALGLARAAAFEPSQRLARALLREAVVLEGGREWAGGPVTAATVERTLQLCSLERRLQKTGACPRADLAPRRTACVSRRLRTLNALRRPLEAALETDRTRWRREVTPCLGWVYDELITTLVDAPLPATVPQTRAARYRAGLGDLAFGLRAARQALDPKVAAAITTRVEASLLPEPGQAVSPVLALIAGRRYAAAEHVATRALAAHGERADLYCARALSRLLLQQVHASVGDLRRALAVDPGSRCARRNLARILTEPGLPADGPGAPVSSRQDSLHNPDGSQSPDAC